MARSLFSARPALNVRKVAAGEPDPRIWRKGREAMLSGERPPMMISGRWITAGEACPGEPPARSPVEGAGAQAATVARPTSNRPTRRTARMLHLLVRDGARGVGASP